MHFGLERGMHFGLGLWAWKKGDWLGLGTLVPDGG